MYSDWTGNCCNIEIELIENVKIIVMPKKKNIKNHLKCIEP